MAAVHEWENLLMPQWRQPTRGQAVGTFSIEEESLEDVYFRENAETRGSDWAFMINGDNSRNDVGTQAVSTFYHFIWIMSVIAEEHVRGGSVFKEIDADDEDNQPTEIESLCMNCYENVSILPNVNDT